MLLKVVKGQTMVDFLVDHPVLGSSKLYEDFSYEVVEVCTTHAASEEQI